MRIPFDSVVLSAVLDELTPYIGGFVQGIRQPDEFTVVLGIYVGAKESEPGREAALLLSCHPNFARVHFVTKRPRNPADPPVFCATLRARLDGARLAGAEQIASDRLLALHFESPKGPHTIIAELMGKHANLILLEEGRRIVSAAKWVRPDKSVRPISPGAHYAWPPVLDHALVNKPSPRTPAEWREFAQAQPKLVSPFFRALCDTAPSFPLDWRPSLSLGNGAYPLPLDAMGIKAIEKESLGIALELHFAAAIAQSELEALRSTLTGQLERVLLARETALADLRQTWTSGQSAGRWQQLGELLLAFGFAPQTDPAAVDAFGYDGAPLKIPTDPDLTVLENANRYFERAKKAKARAGTIQDQIARLEDDRSRVAAMLLIVREATKRADLADLRDEAAKRRWLSENRVQPSKHERPFEGHRVKELFGPGGIRVLFGENAEGNDYLTLRVARPNDLWLHVRGATSAHVVILTNNHPEKITREHLEFAAKVAVQHSANKHSSYVPVDYTLRKYVRRPRGAAKGAALYTQEKTLHVDAEP